MTKEGGTSRAPFLCLFKKDLSIAVQELPRGFAKKMFMKISQNSQENTCARVSFLKKLKA